MSEPTTEAGRALLDDEWPAPSDRADPTEEWVADAHALRSAMAERIAAIEAEARAGLREALHDAMENDADQIGWGDSRTTDLPMEEVHRVIDQVFASHRRRGE